MRLLLFICIILFIFTPNLFSQTNTENPPSENQEEDKTPEPYAEDEFPNWLANLRRMEITLMGSFPLTLLLTFFVYDFVRWGVHDWESGYRPLGNPNRVSYSSNDLIIVFTVAGSLSLTISIIDIVIKTRKDREREKQERYEQ